MQQLRLLKNNLYAIFFKYIFKSISVVTSNSIKEVSSIDPLDPYIEIIPLFNYLLKYGIKKSIAKCNFGSHFFEKSSEIALKTSLLLCGAIVVLTCIDILTPLGIFSNTGGILLC